MALNKAGERSAKHSDSPLFFMYCSWLNSQIDAALTNDLTSPETKNIRTQLARPAAEKHHF